MIHKRKGVVADSFFLLHFFTIYAHKVNLKNINIPNVISKNMYKGKKYTHLKRER